MQKKYLPLLLSSYLLIFFGGCSLFKPDLTEVKPRMENYERTIDQINPENRDYPGGRGVDSLILYTPEFGERTGTNEWGAEAIIVKGVVEVVGGNNSAIPENGFVLSGHGLAARWIVDHFYPGVRVEADGLKLKAIDDDMTRLDFAMGLIQDTRKRLSSERDPHESISMKKLNQYRESAEKEAEKSRKAREAGKNLLSIAHAQKALDKAWKYYYNSQPSLTKELRGCWYRPHEKSPEELEETFKKLADVGFNCLCPETIYWGYAIYPDAHPDLAQNPDFAGWDPLAEMCRLGKKYNIRIIPWVEVFFIGFEDSPLIRTKPEWLALARNGKQYSTVEQGYYYFCPSREEVQKFWLEVYENLLMRYDVDGLQLDYIRYPVSIPWEDGFCYCSNCRELFYNQYEIDPASIDPAKDPGAWEKWAKFRKEQPTRFVRETHEFVKKLRPDISLSVDIFPDLDEALNKKFQDWVLWQEKDWVDETWYMAYTSDLKRFLEGAEELERIKKGDGLHITGLGPYLGFGPEILLEEIRISQEHGSDGICLFALEHLTDKELMALKEGPFRLKAEIPEK